MARAGINSAQSPTVDPREVARFAALAAEWWDPAGRMGAAKFNPCGCVIKEAACRQFERGPQTADSLAGPASSISAAAAAS